jgi:FkbM family methyltransferase
LLEWLPCLRWRDLMQGTLIYDVGMHVGKDTEFYLKKGFSVLAIEANPTLVSQCVEKFSSYIRSGQLRVLNIAIAEKAGRGTLYVCDHTDWSTMCLNIVEHKTKRHDARFQAVDIETMEFGSVLRRYGMPYYLKIDIEGSDAHCLRALGEFQEKPRYISVEVDHTSIEQGAENSYRELFLLRDLGYKNFKYINQMYNSEVKLPNPPKEGFLYVDAAFDWEMSGPFGEETPGPWLDIHEATLMHREIVEGYRRRPSMGVDSWHDIHAK